MQADGGQILPRLRALEDLAPHVRAGGPRLLRAEQDEVAGAGVPHLDVREHAREGVQHERHDAVVHLINVEPLRHDAAVLEPARAQLVKLAAEHAAHTDHPRVRRLADDHVVALRTELEQRARVLADDAREAVGEHATVPRREEFPGAKHRFAILRHRHAVNRVAQQRARRHPAAEAEHEDVLAVRAREHR